MHIEYQLSEADFMPIPKCELSASQITELRTLLETHLSHK
jgi:hypothetical protein